MRSLTPDQLRESLTDRDLAVVTDIHRFRLLSTRQIQRLHFASVHVTIQAATRATHRVLQRLEGNGIVVRLQRRIGGAQRGSAGSLWQLGPNGLATAQDPVSAAKRSRFREPTSGIFVHHTIAVAETAVNVTEAATEHHLEVLALHPEPQAWQKFLGQHGQLEWLRPDLYVVVANKEFEQHTCVEIDRATEHGPQILRKCQVYARYVAVGAAERQSGVIPRVLWVVPDKARQAALERIIRADATVPEWMFTVVTTDRAAEHIMAGLIPPPPG